MTLAMNYGMLVKCKMSWFITTLRIHYYTSASEKRKVWAENSTIMFFIKPECHQFNCDSFEWMFQHGSIPLHITPISDHNCLVQKWTTWPHPMDRASTLVKVVTLTTTQSWRMTNLSASITETNLIASVMAYIRVLTQVCKHATYSTIP